MKKVLAFGLLIFVSLPMHSMHNEEGTEIAHEQFKGVTQAIQCMNDDKFSEKLNAYGNAASIYFNQELISRKPIELETINLTLESVREKPTQTLIAQAEKFVGKKQDLQKLLTKALTTKKDDYQNSYGIYGTESCVNSLKNMKDLYKWRMFRMFQHFFPWLLGGFACVYVGRNYDSGKGIPSVLLGLTSPFVLLGLTSNLLRIKRCMESGKRYFNVHSMLQKMELLNKKYNSMNTTLNQWDPHGNLPDILREAVAKRTE